MDYIFKEKTNMRIDQFLSKEIAHISREKIKARIKEGFIYLNGDIITSPKHILCIGDEIHFFRKGIEENKELKPWIDGVMPEIIFENDDYMIINKPTGLVVHPGIGNIDKTLVNILIAQKMRLSFPETNRPGIVHRLDKNTSGLMIIAKNNEFHTYVSELFTNSKVNKKYHLLSDGKYKSSKGIIDAPIGRDPHNRKLMKVQLKNSRNAKSIFRVLESFKNNEYVEFRILTGRTHQIRVHSKFIGSTILNDPQYGKNIFNLEFGQFLHATELGFTTKEGMEVKYTVKPPKIFIDKLNELRI